jgi:hypothetical protein
MTVTSTPSGEHVFLRRRFHDGYDAYAALRADGLDEDRPRLYRLAMHLSPVAVPLLDGDFPDPEFMRAVAEHSVGQTLTLMENPVP